LKQRHKVLGLLGALSLLTFLDRMAIAVAGPQIQLDLHIQPHYWGWVLSAYVFANGIFEVPFGALGDKNGQRGILPRIVVWWSSFNLLTAWCRSFWQLCAARFFFGLGAAGAYPNCAGAIARRGAGAQPGCRVGGKPPGRSACAPTDHPTAAILRLAACVCAAWRGGFLLGLYVSQDVPRPA
jgi:MFS family permease